MPPETATSNIYSARPTLLLDGREDFVLSDGVQSLMVLETTLGLYCCEMTIGNWGNPNGSVTYLYFDRQIIDFGKKIEITLGEAETAQNVFEGHVTAIEGRFLQNRSPEITILAEDRFQDLRMTRRTRSFEDVSDTDVIEQIASDHSLQTEIDIDGPAQHRVLCQVNQSDLAFLRERARAIDAELWITGSTLHAQARSRRSEGEIVFGYGQRLKEFSVLADLTHQCTQLTVSGWDVSAKQGMTHDATETAIQPELGNGELSGSALLRNALGERTQQVVHEVTHNDEETRYFAESAYRRNARRFVTGRAVLEGDGRLRVGAHVSLSGLDRMFNGQYYVTEVRHLFDISQGYRSVIEVERPGIGQ
jgi:phage protein D